MDKDHFSRKKQWNDEYTHLKGIDLNFKQEVPPSVSLFLEFIINQKEKFSSVLDIGCGKGRISLHLALAGFTVTGFDFVSSAIKEFRDLTREYGLEEKITGFQQDINEVWQVPSHSMQAAFAITVIDNLTQPEEQNHFKTELIRVLKPQGLLIIESYLPRDGYYGPLLEQSKEKDKGLLTDPHNNIRFKIYSRKEIIGLLSPQLELLKEELSIFESFKYGKTYPRASQIMIFRKK